MKLLLIMMAALMLPVVPALACFPQQETDEILFQSEDEGAYGGRNFDRNPLPMSYCELPEPGYVIVEGKCYDFDAITDFDTEEECQADPVCKAYREEQRKQQEQDQEQEYDPCECAASNSCVLPIPCETPPSDSDRTDDPNHGEIKGDEELEEEQDEEEHQEEEEQGQEKSEETTEETDE